MKKIMADWANLPFDLLLIIATRIRLLDDYVSFCLVCKSWLKLLYFKDKNYSCPSLYPMLIFNEKEYSQPEFYNPFSGGGVICKSRLPEIRGKRYWGSSNGWLITLDAKYQIHLFNPFSRLQIQLPMLVPNTDIPINDDFYNKIIVSVDPSSDELVVFALYSDHIRRNQKASSIKLGAKSWIHLQCATEITLDYLYDALYFDGKFYLVGLTDLAICSSNGLHLQTIFLPWFLNLSVSSFNQSDISYIVRLGGDICVITRSSRGDSKRDFIHDETFRFKVFKLDEHNIDFEKTCEELVSLGDWSIFLGSNNSFDISCIEYPDCKSNCIYFTDSHAPRKILSSYDTGVYNYADGTIKLFPKKKNLYLKQHVLPVWVKPFW